MLVNNYQLINLLFSLLLNKLNKSIDFILMKDEVIIYIIGCFGEDMFLSFKSSHSVLT